MLLQIIGWTVFQSKLSRSLKVTVWWVPGSIEIMLKTQVSVKCSARIAKQLCLTLQVNTMQKLVVPDTFPGGWVDGLVDC